MGELKIILTEKTLTVSQYGMPTTTFQLVDEYPPGYQIWNIGTNMPKGYLPFCRLSTRQPFDGGRNIEVETLKAMKVEGAEDVLAAIGRGQDTIEEMEKYLVRYKNAEPGTWPYLQTQRIRTALPILKKLNIQRFG